MTNNQPFTITRHVNGGDVPFTLTPGELQEAWEFQRRVLATNETRDRVYGFLDMNSLDRGFLPKDFDRWIETATPEIAERFLMNQCSTAADDDTWDETIDPFVDSYLGDYWIRQILRAGKAGNMDYPALSCIIAEYTGSMKILTRDNFNRDGDKVRDLLEACPCFDLIPFLPEDEEPDHPDFTYAHTILAQEQDGLETMTNAYSFRAVYERVEDLMSAIKGACLEYCRTEKGRKEYERNNRHFDFGDLDLLVPMSICEKHGFRIVRVPTPEILDAGEQLVDESDLANGKE